MATHGFIMLAEARIIAAKQAADAAIEAALLEIKANAPLGMAGGKLSGVNRDCWGTLAMNAQALATSAARLAKLVEVNLPAL